MSVDAGNPRPPGPLVGPDVWRGIDLAAAPSGWIRQLTADEIGALDAVADRFADQPLEHMTVDDLAFEPLRAHLRAWQREILFARGFVVLRGLPVDGIARAAARLWALGLHLGRPVAQNARGDLLGHVCDLGHDANDPQTRLYQTAQRQGYHTDSADVVGLLCLRPARAGGRSSLASVAAAYNEVLSRAPDLVDALFDPVATDQRGEPTGARPWFEIPVLSFFAGRLTGCYQRHYIESAARFPAAPRLTDRHRAALDILDTVLDDPTVHLAMDLQPGDVQWVHNHQILHDRTAFRDDPHPALRRHLLRLWLCPPTGRLLPPVFAERYGSVEVGRRGGVVTSVAPSVSLRPQDARRDTMSASLVSGAARG